MTKQTIAGSSLIIVAVAMFALGVGDKISDLKDWHGLATPEIVGAVIKDAAQVLMAAMGGTLLPGVWTAKPNGGI